MMAWTDGYVTDVGYPAFFYKEMEPLWLSTTARMLGFAAPDAYDAFTLCELGCGVGINMLVAASCHPQARFVGVDFNPDHVRIARKAAMESGIDNVDFIHADFATFARHDDQRFDFMVSHGVWSWIAQGHRDALLDCVSGRLKPGGLLYLHYMCHPGSTDLAPLQHLLNLCAHHMPGSSSQKARTGLKLLQHMAQDGVFADKPATLRHIANMARRNPADLAHEFLTDHWRPQHCVDVHRQVGQTGTAFVGSADMFNNLDISLSIPVAAQALIRRTRVPALAETLKDMARNAHQRMDLFQKNPEELNAAAFKSAVEAMRFRLLPDAPRCGPIRFSTPIGPVEGPEEIFTPLLQRLSAGSATIAELARLPIFTGDLGSLIQSLQLLMMQQMAHPCLNDERTNNVQARNLSDWFARNGIALTIMEQCGIALPRDDG